MSIEEAIDSYYIINEHGKIIVKMYLIENKEVTLLVKVNR